jgi:hypothetical protein
MVQFALLAFTARQQEQAGQQAEVNRKSQANIDLFNAQVQENEAKAKEQKARVAGQRFAREAERTKARQKTRIAAAGGAGSPVAEDLSAAQTAEFDLEEMLIKFEGDVAAGRSRSQAGIDRFSSSLSKTRGKNARKAGQVKAGTTLLQGFA